METQKIEFKTPYGDFILVIQDRGFYLADVGTDEVLVDASILESPWPVEILVNLSTRDFYFNKSSNKHEVSFGIGRMIT